ncbi:MAG: hypothetical protein ACXAC8_09890 [Candidatus Hodarchaeales archaeon]|jgi:hypothetical protein
MRKLPLGSSKQSLGKLRSLIVISDWISFADPDKPTNLRWFYKNQEVESIIASGVIFIPVDFSRLIHTDRSYFLLYGAGIYWTKFSISKHAITSDTRYINGLVIPEEKWLDNHFSTEPFVFPPPYDFMIIGDNLQEFSFTALRSQEDHTGHSRRAFGRGMILTQLIFPFKEPLVMLQKTTEKYEEFDSPQTPMRVLISEFANGRIVNEIALESNIKTYEQTLPGVRRIIPNLMQIFPEKWSNEIYLNGLRSEISKISKDFAFIGAPMILK